MNKSLAIVLSLVASGTVSAQGMNMPMESKKGPSVSSKSAIPPLVDAVVQKIDTEKALIVLKHGDIPNLGMPAMVMGFDVADKKMLSAVKTGDKVKFHVEMVGGKATITELKRAG